MTDRENLKNLFEKMLERGDEWQPTDYSEIYTTDSSRILIAADLHIPKHDIPLVAGMLAYAYEHRLDTIILLGDLLDMEEVSSWGVDDPTSRINRNLRYTGEFITRLVNAGFKVIWSLGNHEHRLYRSTKGQLDLESLAMMAGLHSYMDDGRVVVSHHPTVYGSVGNWMFTHPAMFGMPGVTPSKLAVRYQKNVVSAHEHSLAMVRDDADKFWAINCGGLFDPKYHKYIQHNVTTHRSWVSGFATVINGRPAIHHGNDYR